MVPLRETLITVHPNLIFPITNGRRLSLEQDFYSWTPISKPVFSLPILRMMVDRRRVFGSLWCKLPELLETLVVSGVISQPC
ncbi:hypothetical protein F511_18295 [Dorcoceras hygrometricum]|uniref:Uncharacterized protein n=1 Tax=Dorcoceras hygrometricum TaxID=472368 RepID=A0A2Z7CUX7_9LAMI|nr:hypothetical protein F511_18295 [Dorcoceras hygrometricum]